MIPIARPMIEAEEKEAVLAVLDSGMLAQGEWVASFEKAFAKYIGVKHAVAASSGTAALHLAMLAHGIGPGDEVITSPFTFIATANAVLYTGARPVFVDIEPDTFDIDPNQVEESITQRTKAILPVHLFGHPAEMDAIMEIAERHGLTVIEDAAQAHGAEYHGQRVGSFGTGVFSFYPTKNMTTGEGGMLTTDDDFLAGKLRLLRDHGMPRRYVHEVLGYNFRMTNIAAAIGLAQLSKLDGFNSARIGNATYLTERIHKVITPTVRPGVKHVFHQYTVRVPSGRDDAVEKLREAGVGVGIYYPIPIHQQSLYRGLGYHERFPAAEQAASEVLSLPVHPALTQEDLNRIVEVVEAL